MASAEADGAPRRGQSHSKPSTARVDGAGDVSALVTTPATAAPGEYELTVKGLGTDCSTVKRVNAKIELTGPGGKRQDTAGPAAAPGGGAGSTGLAFTGLELWLLLCAGAGLLVGGLLLRRRTAEGAG